MDFEGGEGPAPDNARWKLGGHHSAHQWADKMGKRGWTDTQIDEALAGGQTFPATNQINPGNAARRHVHPSTGRSIVVDDVTGEVIHVGGDGFLY